MPLRFRPLVMVLALLALVAGVAAGCGGGSEEDAKALLKRGFNEPIGSANVTVDVSAKVDGVPQLSQPVRVKLGGPYQSNGKARVPSLNWDVTVTGGGQTFSLGLVSTGDNGFVTYQGTNYDLGSFWDRLKQAVAQGATSGSGSLGQFGVNPLDWVKDASVEGDSNIAGIATKHVSSGIDIEKLFKDLNKVVARAGGAVGQAKPSQLTPQNIDQIKNVVKDPRLDVNVGKKDGKIRRLQLSVDFEVPKKSQPKARGIKGGNFTLAVEFANVGQPQRIQAPSNAKPISELLKQLPLNGALGGIGGAGGGSSSGGSSGLPGGTPGGAPGSAGGGGKSPSSEQFRRYAECLNKAKPSDTAALQKCSEILK